MERIRTPLMALLVLFTASPLLPGQGVATKEPPRERITPWKPVASIDDLAAMPASDDYLIFKGVGDAAAAALSKRHGVRGVLFRAAGKSLTDAGLKSLTQVPDLCSLVIEGPTALTHAGIRQLRNMPALEEVGLVQVPHDPDILSIILQLPQLRRIDLVLSGNSAGADRARID